MTQFRAITWLAAGLLATGAQAAKVPLYDDFSGTEIDRAKWQETETWRYVDESKGRLFLGRRVMGGDTSDSGLALDSLNLSMTQTAPVKTLRTTITVTDIEVSESCAANPAPTFSRARLLGAFFNIRPGGPLPGDRTGDVLAQMRVGRTSSSGDAQGLLRVQGVLSACTNADCSTSNVIGSVADFGTVPIGTATTVQIDWDKRNNLFLFTRDKLPAIPVAYTDADNVAPELAVNNVSLRNEVPNCLSGARVKAGIGAQFDNVGLAAN